MNFWQNLPQPILGLAPMDGVTDAPCRYMMAKYGSPDVVFTEFCSVDGLVRDVPKLLQDFEYAESERPIVAQIYGKDPESFYKVAHLVAELGFDGLDINMGCPSKSIATRGCGAGLIQDPKLAKDIIRACKQGILHWTEGSHRFEDCFGSKMMGRIQEMKSQHPKRKDRKPIPVSVKTRLGFDHNCITDWVKHLLEEEPVVISIHGRTLKQMYRGQADWEAIAQAAEIIRQSSTLVLGNGDIQSLKEAKERIQSSKVHGVLIGRGAMGNPWIFRKKDLFRKSCLNQSQEDFECTLTQEEIFKVLLDHCQYYEALKGATRFFEMRKHLGWYCRGFRYAKEARVRLLRTHSAREVKQVIQDYQ